ncbi:MAG: hypothetical protein JRJ04_12285 [Deltaproteobacteria bacterium]|nr:hypothetical protein [Deltaproteobacteria bacterium]
MIRPTLLRFESLPSAQGQSEALGGLSAAPRSDPPETQTDGHILGSAYNGDVPTEQSKLIEIAGLADALSAVECETTGLQSRSSFA